uniref:Uncharacterized protein n=1 Tax=Arundo donax TaxID=35708 RepID=A0A0A9CX89_ARUDO
MLQTPMPRSERWTGRGLDSGKWKTRFKRSSQRHSSTWRSSTRQSAAYASRRLSCGGRSFSFSATKEKRWRRRRGPVSSEPSTFAGASPGRRWMSRQEVGCAQRLFQRSRHPWSSAAVRMASLSGR